MTDFTTLAPYDLQFRVERLLAAYVECIDDDALEQWPDFFTDPCRYEIVSRENTDRGLTLPTLFCDSVGMLRDRVVSLRHANIYARHYYRHVLSNVHVKAVRPDVVEVQSNYAVLQTLLEGDTHIFNAGRYLDEVVETPDGLRFRSKRVIYDTYRIPNLMVTPI